VDIKRDLAELHSTLVNVGEYVAAKKIQNLITHGSVILGPSDWKVQCLLEDMGIPVWPLSLKLGKARIA